MSPDTIIVFGGMRNSCGVQEPLNDMWTYNMQHFQWKCLTPKTDDMHDPGKVCVPLACMCMRDGGVDCNTGYVRSQPSLFECFHLRCTFGGLYAGARRNEARAGECMPLLLAAAANVTLLLTT